MELGRDGRLLFVARAVRAFAFGWLSVVLALYLAKRGLSRRPRSAPSSRPRWSRTRS